MKKYWVVFKNSLQVSLAYRFNTFTYLLAEFFSLSAMIYLWVSIYNQGNQIGTYTLKGLIIYYILTKFISVAMYSQDIAWATGDKIRKGEIINYMVKPINFQNNIFFSNLGKIFYNVLIYSLIFGIILIIGFRDLSFEPLVLLYFILAIIISVVINFLIFYIVGISTFYFGFVMGFNFIMHNIIHFLSGGVIPIDLLPARLFDIINFLPFKYIFFTPISIITGRISSDEIAPLFLTGFFWIIILYFLSVVLYNIGIKKYEAYSG